MTDCDTDFKQLESEWENACKIEGLQFLYTRFSDELYWDRYNNPIAHQVAMKLRSNFKVWDNFIKDRIEQLPEYKWDEQLSEYEGHRQVIRKKKTFGCHYTKLVHENGLISIRWK
jgi:hypothetical protein